MLEMDSSGPRSHDAGSASTLATLQRARVTSTNTMTGVAQRFPISPIALQKFRQRYCAVPPINDTPKLLISANRYPLSFFLVYTGGPEYT